ncbi:hypothetical protein KC614_03715 [candidate division WWE3 bacterium]|uniref:Uncharacterized protein n=1 Tax=candidate division WWE3 bacterium TaxID=2053526 RepID=A0A955LKQ9_UNCKA|nr:hypothetical protein [candidate division WWE3 bacterium]
MATLTWGEDNRYVYGIDRGVLHGQDSDEMYAWNGLTAVSVDEVNTPELVSSFDGKTYANLIFRGFYEAEVSALSFPYEAMSLNGEVEALPGFIFTAQEKELYDFSYRTFENDEDYKIHFVWNAIFVQKAKSRRTLSDNLNALEFKWKVSAVPELMPYWYPASSLIVDSKLTDPDVLSSLEDLLYGTDITDPTFPSQLDVLLEYIV